MNSQKATTQEVEQIRKLIDRLAYDVEQKPGFKDLDGQAGHQKDMIEDLNKELTLKASVKDIC